jgi:hypothetical protein
LLKVSPAPSPRRRAAGRRFAMIGVIVRVGFGFILACLAASAVMTGFVVTPADIAGGAPDRLTAAGALTLLSAIHCARFAAPFALIAAVIGEWRSIRGWMYYAIVGTAIAFAGFMTQYANTPASEPAIADSYALAAFLAAGFAGGFVYWAFAGRLAGDPGGSRLQPGAGPPGRSAASGAGPTSADTQVSPDGKSTSRHRRSSSRRWRRRHELQRISTEKRCSLRCKGFLLQRHRTYSVTDSSPEGRRRRRRWRGRYPGLAEVSYVQFGFADGSREGLDRYGARLYDRVHVDGARHDKPGAFAVVPICRERCSAGSSRGDTSGRHAPARALLVPRAQSKSIRIRIGLAGRHPAAPLRFGMAYDAAANEPLCVAWLGGIAITAAIMDRHDGCGHGRISAAAIL